MIILYLTQSNNQFKKSGRFQLDKFHGLNEGILPYVVNDEYIHIPARVVLPSPVSDYFSEVGIEETKTRRYTKVRTRI